MVFWRGLLKVVFATALPVLLVSCSDVEVPGADKPYPKLADFPTDTSPEELDKRRRRLVGKYGDAAGALGKAQQRPSRPPEGALRVAVIQFEHAKFEVDNAGKDILSQVAAYAQQSRASVWLFGYGSRRIELVTGETPAAASRALAEDRAREVAVILVKEGVPADRLYLITRGASDPMFHETAETGVAGNRRVEIFLVREKSPGTVSAPGS